MVLVAGSRGMWKFGRCRKNKVVYSCFAGTFFGFLVLSQISAKVEQLTIKQPVSSKVVAEPRVLSRRSSRPFQSPTDRTAADNLMEPPGTVCQPLHYIPDAETRPVTALASFPGSGNTWLRYLIQQATGVHTGSQFVDDTLLNSGFPGESVFNASVAVVKTHQWQPSVRSRFQKAVLLIRQPQPALQSLFNLYNSQDHTGCASPQHYNRDRGFYWKKFFKGNLRTWKLTNLFWIHTFQGPLHIVFYDHLRNDLERTLRSLVLFLDLPLNETALQCTIKHSEGLYHRKPCSDSFDPFTDDMKREVEKVETYVYEEIAKYT